MADTTTIPDNILQVEIQDPTGLIFQGPADAVSSYNEGGLFDVYPLHIHFISIIRQGLTIYKNKTKIKEMQIESGIIKVLNNKVQIFLGI